MKKKFKNAILQAAFCVMLIGMSFCANSQTPGGPGPGGNGGSGDTPLGMPIDGKLDILLLAGGIFLALAVVKRLHKKQMGH